MTDDNESYGACIVALPEIPNNLDVEVDGGEHVTLLYISNEDLSMEDYKLLVDLILDIFNSEPKEKYEWQTAGIEEFGEDGDAVVMRLADADDERYVLLRERIIESLPSHIRETFDANVTFPDYKPHITLGYKSLGYIRDDDLEETIPDSVIIKGLGVWNGETQFNLAYPETVVEDESVAMSDYYSTPPEVFKTDDVSEYFQHIGVIRRSGRYPWGSGDNPYQRNSSFLSEVENLRKQGMSETEIAKGMGMTTTQLRAAKSIAKNQKRAADIAEAQRLKDKGYSNVAIGERLGVGESQVRALLTPGAKERNDVLMATSNMLKDNVADDRYIDIGEGVHAQLGVSREKLRSSVAILEEQGYEVHNVKVQQLGTGEQTTIKVLVPPGVSQKEVWENQDRISTLENYSEDGGRTYLGLEPPRAVRSDRVSIRYGEDGGADMDGVIQLRRGVDDISLGHDNYAQVRISVDGTHYLKGMAVYSDNLPDGVDIVFNTNKKNTGNKLDAMKPQKDDEDNPFGATVRQRHYIDKDGKEQLSAINIVNDEASWSTWSKNLPSQMLSKQPVELARQQLDLAFKSKQEQYEEIMSLTNPAVQKRLLQSFSDDVDSASVHLKAAALPRQATHVILPVNSLKDTEIYAPNYRNGEKVALVRFPHGGKFEIPELTVNNRNPEAKSFMENAVSAVGINSKVASRLSGADFDGDTVLVIPNNSGKVKSSPSLKGLENFDPKRSYPGYEGMRPMSERTKQLKMGDVSNLITDMTIRGATDTELAAAVRHSMVVIDAKNHKLNYKQSYIDNDIAGLKKKYQGGSTKGASTLISRASSEQRVEERIPRRARNGGPIDPKTGKLVYEPTGRTYTDKNGRVVPSTTKSTKMAETNDATSLSSGTRMESVYATYANRLKSLANDARKSMVTIKDRAYSKTARETYDPQVQSLTAKLNLALKNKPRERQAQLLANATVKAKRQANPNMDAEDLKKVKSQALNAARERTGAKKYNVDITPIEWEAIQSGAVSTNKLNQILTNTDIEVVKKYATPRTTYEVQGAKLARARSMLAAGYTQAEIADALGVPASTLNDSLAR